MLKALEPHGICLVLARDLAGSFASSSVGASVHTFASDIEFAYMFARVAAGTPATDDEEMQLRKKLGLYPGSFEANNIDCRLINDAEQIGLLTRESAENGRAVLHVRPTAQLGGKVLNTHHAVLDGVGLSM